MQQKLYRLMDWPAIEAICYAEEDQPQKVLGAHVVGSASLYQTFLPEAVKVDLVLEVEDKNIPMGMVDEEGFFAAVVSGKKKEAYHYVATDAKGKSFIYKDPYQFYPKLSEEDEIKLKQGIHYHSYDILGSHFTEMDGIKGVVFRVWAPNAMRVSVVGDFNNWDGRRNPMIRYKDTGIFMLFIPELKEGMNYQYEIRAKGDRVFLKNDPYCIESTNTPKMASVLHENVKFDWNDDEWMKAREKFDVIKSAISIYEVNLNVFQDDEAKNISLKTIAKDLIPYVKKMKYTHIELMPVMEYTDDYFNGYQTTGYYSFASRYGSREEFMSFIDSFHLAGIGVILDWVPSYFAKDEHGLCSFDGTYLYGHLDERQRQNVAYEAYNYNYARPEVSNYLIANGIYWIEEFHADGIRMSGLSSMLYMDYGKTNLQWAPNIYGGNENLDGIEFIKHFNSIVHKLYPGILSIAKETSAWPNITLDVDSDGLGFDYVWNTGFTNHLISYIRKNSDERVNSLNELTDSFSYAFNEHYILPISHNEIYRSEGSLMEIMDVEDSFKEAFLRLVYSYLFCHPGKKMFYMNNEEDTLVEALQSLYQKEAALSLYDDSNECIKWVDGFNGNGVLSFIRKGEFLEDSLLIVMNVSEDKKRSVELDVPFEGKYKLIFHSNQKEFGGTVSIKTKELSTKENIDDHKFVLNLELSPMSLSIYSYRPFTKEELLKIAEAKVELIRAQLEAEALEKAKLISNKTKSNKKTSTKTAEKTAVNSKVAKSSSKTASKSTVEKSSKK